MFTATTRRKILKFLKSEGDEVFGDLSERDFLVHIYDIINLKSTDSRYFDFHGDYHQHRINNYDWEDGRRLADMRTGIPFIDKDTLVRLLETLVNSYCRLDLDEVKRYRDAINDIIKRDGYILTAVAQISGQNVYEVKEISDDPLHIAEDVLQFNKDTTYFGKISYAKRLFWNPISGSDEKRSAIKELADVLELLRDDFKKLNLTKDENSLFGIANEYTIRHNNKNQKRDYDQDVFYDFIFVLYLNQIKLIEGLKNKDS